MPAAPDIQRIITRLTLALSAVIAVSMLVAAPALAQVGLGSAPTGGGLPAPVTQAAAPVTQAAAPVTQAAAPVTQAAAPVTQAAAPVTQAAAPVTQAAAPVTQAAAPVTQAAARHQAAAGHAGSRPGHAGSRPGHAGSRPGHAGSRPGHAGSRPGHAGSRPGHAGSRPGHARQLLRSSGSPPRPSPRPSRRPSKQSLHSSRRQRWTSLPRCRPLTPSEPARSRLPSRRRPGLWGARFASRTTRSLVAERAHPRVQTQTSQPHLRSSPPALRLPKSRRRRSPRARLLP